MPDDTLEGASQKAMMAQEVLGRVIHTTDNLDDKVGRVFGSMSFLMVGAVILYTSFIADRLYYRAGGVDLVSLVFVLFVLCVAISTGFMLQAMGPRVHYLPWRRPGKASPDAKASPTAYADRIAAMDGAEWSEYFLNAPLKDMYEMWYIETVREVHILSKKVDKKVGEMRWAQWFFLLSIGLLVLMVFLAASSLL